MILAHESKCSGELNKNPLHPGLSEYGSNKHAPLEPRAPSANNLKARTFNRSVFIFPF
jgi:hypothetical protein